MNLIDGQDAARGILAVNPEAEGSDEWHAWALGYDYAVATGGCYGDTPLSGGWAGQMTPSQLLRHVDDAQGFDHGVWDDTDAVDSICDAFELGYATWVAGWRL